MIIAALPAFNEESTIEKLVIGCEKYVDKVIVVDDGSTDSTAAIAKEHGAIVKQHSKNMGYGAAIHTIFKAAGDMNAHILVILDADGQHDPDEIPKLLEPIARGDADIVVGSRFLEGKGRNVPLYRRIGIKILDLVTNLTGQINVSDTQSGYRAYSQRAIEKLQIKSMDMAVSSEILLQIEEKDLKLEEVSINCRYDVKIHSSQNPFKHGLSVLIRVFKEKNFYRPMSYFTIPSLVFMVVGLTGVSKPIHGAAIPEFPSGISLSFVTSIVCYGIFRQKFKKK